jgi:hypothetical protein
MERRKEKNRLNNIYGKKRGSKIRKQAKGRRSNKCTGRNEAKKNLADLN